MPLYAPLGLALLLGSAQAPSVIQSSLDAQYKALTTAVVKKDWKAFADEMTDDFKTVRASGPALDKKSIVDGFKQQRAMMSNITWTRHIDKLKLVNGVAQVTVFGKFKSDFDAGDGKHHSFSMSAYSADEWVKVGSKWKLRKTTIQSVKVLMDGKPAQTA